jgi:sugar phosphate isomerase/epimerase
MLKSVTVDYKRKKTRTPGMLDPELYDYVKAAGFDGCDISTYSPVFYQESDWEAKIYRIREMLEERGLVCTQMHLPVHDIKLSSEIVQEDVKEATLQALRAMKILGCKWAAYHPRTAFSNDSRPDVSLRDNYNEISVYLEEAERLDVGIAIENIPIFPDCPHFKFYTADYQDFRELVDIFHSDHIGVCWDFGHANLMATRQERGMELLGDKIRITHVASNRGYFDDHLVPTVGTVNWRSIMPALRAAGYSGDLNLELNFYDMGRALKSYLAHAYDGLCMLEELFLGEEQ